VGACTASEAAALSQAPETELVNLNVNFCARSGMADLFEMLQSRTFMQQLGYGLLKIGLINLFPELKLLFRKIERGALDTAGGHPSPPGGAAAANSGSEHAAPTSSSKSLKEPRKH
jgi:hypothetical protein